MPEKRMKLLTLMKENNGGRRAAARCSIVQKNRQAKTRGEGMRAWKKEICEHGAFFV